MLCAFYHPVVSRADLPLASFMVPLELERRSLFYVTMDPAFASLSGLGSDDSAAMKNPPELEVDATDGSFANKHRRHVVGHVDDYDALQQQIGEGKLLVQKILSLTRPACSIPGLDSQGAEVTTPEPSSFLYSDCTFLAVLYFCVSCLPAAEEVADVHSIRPFSVSHFHAATEQAT